MVGITADGRITSIMHHSRDDMIWLRPALYLDLCVVYRIAPIAYVTVSYQESKRVSAWI